MHKRRNVPAQSVPAAFFAALIRLSGVGAVVCADAIVAVVAMMARAIITAIGLISFFLVSEDTPPDDSVQCGAYSCAAVRRERSTSAISAGVSFHEAARLLARTWSAVLAPAMTLQTSGRAASQEK